MKGRKYLISFQAMDHRGAKAYGNAFSHATGLSEEGIRSWERQIKDVEGVQSVVILNVVPMDEWSEM